MPATVPSTSGYRVHKHRSTEYLENKQKASPFPAKKTHTKENKPKQVKTHQVNTRKNQMTKLLSSSFVQQLAASLERARKESKWGRELSLCDQIRTGKIIWLFIAWINYHYHHLSLFFSFCLLIYDVMLFRFPRHLKCRWFQTPAHKHQKLLLTASMPSRGTK